ncbi:MAG TPA: DMT family transporter [bacterium]|uniref:EamA-like transporter family protein n=1 Tax=candidate division TA06 bacterium ADurb.Bin417 TaxID=1852828 RepID=A0A1V5MFV8_UNCT6|nr:MAG: EamA-like transporter family protein [candidate division TA06 bacterium ADurb.Bin417]HNQ35712.1 DMT family transporter [bacterium]HNS47985.1 DMT family transporter [bacterium]
MRKGKQILWLAVYGVGGSLVVVFQRYLTFHFDNLTQNAYRFLAGSAALFLLAHHFFRAELVRLLKDRRQILRIFGSALLLTAPTFLIVEGIARTTAALAGLLHTMAIPLTLLLALALFPDERNLGQPGFFLAGTLAALAGTVGLTLSGGSLAFQRSIGNLYVLAATLVGVACGLIIKRLVRDTQPVCLGAFTCGFVGLLFLAVLAVQGRMTAFLGAGFLPVTVLFFSGVYGMLIGVGLAYTLIRKAGLITVRLTDLAMPVFTALFGFLLFGERLARTQMLYGGLVLGGCLMVLLNRPHR